MFRNLRYTKIISNHGFTLFHNFTPVLNMISNTKQVEDVVGLNSLGHCFFLEDGNERNNTLRHNLGLVTKSATLLPSDRNHVTCRTLTTHPTVYMPNPDLDCK